MNTSFFQRAAIAVVMIAPALGWAQNINVVVSIAPPPLPVYEQPPLPAEGYIWSPGYWAYEDGDYYWVPGTWVRPPSVGLFWTPGYWAWSNGGYIFNRGYWGPRVGFYGGVNYGYGYTGVGYQGGYWNRGAFYYNRSINNFGNRHVTRVYNKTVINNVTFNHISYNGGDGGINVRPNARDQSYARQRHVAPTSAQVQHFQQAVRDKEQRASVNQGRPPIAATDRAGRFDRSAAVPARAAGGPQPDRSDNRRDDRQQANRSQDNRPNNATPGPDRQGQNGPRGDAPRRGQELIQDASRPQNAPNGARVNSVGNDDRSRQTFDREQRDRVQQQQQQQRQQVQQEQQTQQRREQQIQRDQQQSQQRQEQQAQRAQQDQQQREQQSRQRDQQVRQREEQQDRRAQQQQREQQHAQQAQQHQQQQQQQRAQQAQQREQQQQVRQQQEQQRRAEPRERPEQRRPQGEPRQEQRGKE